MLGIFGGSAMIRRLSVPELGAVDLIAMVGFTLLLLPLMMSRYQISRREGVLLLALYGIYLWYVATAI